MFKILPIIVSFVLAGAGGVAVTTPTILHSITNADTQTTVNATLQSDAGANVQDSADLFLSANVMPLDVGVDAGSDTSSVVTVK